MPFGLPFTPFPKTDMHPKKNMRSIYDKEGVNLIDKRPRIWFTRTFHGVEHRSSCGIIEDPRIYGRSIQENDSCFPIYFYRMPLNCTSIHFVQKQTASLWWSPQFSRPQLVQVAQKRPAASIVGTSVSSLICPVVVEPCGCTCRYAAGTVPILYFALFETRSFSVRKTPGFKQSKV
jgi:hypothetical protein